MGVSGADVGPQAMLPAIKNLLPTPVLTVARAIRRRTEPLTYGVQLYMLKLIGKLPAHTMRRIFYRSAGVRLGSGAVIYGGAEIRAPRSVQIGANTIVGNDAILDGRAGIQIGAEVNLSGEVAIWTVQHDPQDANFGTKSGSVVVHDRAWLSFRVTVLPGVTIGEGAVVAAGAVVTHDVPPYTIAAGIPARVIGDRTRDLTYSLAGRPLACI
jgi:acetyltransferase-like isoleucine patch superfamily enzyme